MPLKVNGVLIENLNELEKADAGDTRQRAFCNHEYIKANPLMPNSAWTTSVFKINGELAQFAHKGLRPRFIHKAIAVGKTTHTLLKEGNSTWYVDIPSIVGGGIASRTKLGEMQCLLIEMIGAGGGGSGGGAALNGVGGGAGAFALFVLDLREQSRFFVEVGAGGAGSSNRGQAGSGEATSLYVGESADAANLIISCGGGGGGDGGDLGDGGTVTLGPRSDLIVMIHNSTGSNGYAGLSGTHTFEATTLSCGLEGETQCEKTYGPYSVTSNEAGAGANSFLGAGGAPGSAYGDNGITPSSNGAGGGGGRMKAFGSTTGGNGWHGAIRFYY